MPGERPPVSMSARCPSGWGGAWGAPGARLSTAHATLAVHAPARCSRAVTFTYTPILVLRRLLDSRLGLCSLRGWRPLGPRAGSGRQRTGLRLATLPACGGPRLGFSWGRPSWPCGGPVPCCSGTQCRGLGRGCRVWRSAGPPSPGGRLHRGPDTALVWTSGWVWHPPFDLGVLWARER